jgi:hypothetical protein
MMRDKIAAELWRVEAVDAGVPESVAKGRTPEAFADQSPELRARWFKFADAILAALPGWQPIETAPERQTILVCQSQNSIMATARGKNKHGNWRTGVGPMDYIAGVTHWMPLPDAPDRAAVCKAMGLP